MTDQSETKPHASCQTCGQQLPEPTEVDSLDLFRVMAALRDADGRTLVSVLTEDYSSKYPAEFVTRKVVVFPTFAGYAYKIEDR